MSWTATITSPQPQIRCFQYCLRNHQYLFLWCRFLCHHSPTRSHGHPTLQYNRAREKEHPSHMWHSTLLARQESRWVYLSSHRGFHLSGYLENKRIVREESSNEEKIVINNEKLEANKEVIKIPEPLKDSVSSHSSKSPNHDDASDSLPSVSPEIKIKSESETSPKKTESIINSSEVSVKAIESVKLPSRVQHYFLKRYTWYLRRFQDSLKDEMPDTFRMLNIFTVGVKEFVIDFKDFIMVLVMLSLPGVSLRSLTHHQLLLYHHMPRDMVRVFPVLLLSSIPFGQNVAFPIGYWFPRHLLCRHFWDIQQRHDFAVMSLKQRLFNARPVFRSLQAALSTISDEELQEKCKNVFHKLGSGIHPTIDEILSLLPLFQQAPFHVRSLRGVHVNGLLRLHGRAVLGLRRRRLEDHARVLHCMDAALTSETLATLPFDTLKTCLFLRGLNPTSMSTAAMMEFLDNWLTVSKALDRSSYSLLLHLPILLTYNQPTNILLIY